MAQKKKLIIAIDGGGIRGVIPLVHLREIQLLLHRNIHEFLTEWWGTSTGALISASLQVQRDSRFIHRIQSVLDLYEFRSRATANPPQVSNPARAFEKLLERNFGRQKMSDFRGLHIVATRQPDQSAVIFDENSDCAVADAVRASCSVPFLFPPKMIGEHEYLDGYIVAKNPSALAKEKLIWNENTVFLSLGCGILRQHDEIEEKVKQTHHEIARKAADTGLNYFRFDPTLQFATDDMLNTTPRNIFNLKRDAMDNIHWNWDQLAKLSALLNR